MFFKKACLRPWSLSFGTSGVPHYTMLLNVEFPTNLTDTYFKEVKVAGWPAVQK